MNRIFSIRRTVYICFICALGMVIICYLWILQTSEPAVHSDAALRALNILNAEESNKSWILTLSNSTLISSKFSHHVKKGIGIVEMHHHVLRNESRFSETNNINYKTDRGMNYTRDGLLTPNISTVSSINSDSGINQVSAATQQTVRKSLTAEVLPLAADNNHELFTQQTMQDINRQSSASGLVNVVAMSLYGAQLRYTAGVMRNAYLMRQNFPGWKLWIYIESPMSSKYPAVPENVISQLVSAGAEVHYISPEDDMIPPMMWRFLVADDAAVDWFIVRDADSRLTQRDAATVAVWMQSSRAFHCVRDHPSHATYAISGGLWGGRAPLLRLVLRRSWATMMHGVAAGYLNDMNFLNSVIWPRVERHAYCVDSVSCDHWPNAFPFPVARNGYEHVGQVYDEHDLPRNGDVQILKHTLENRKCLPLLQNQ